MMVAAKVQENKKAVNPLDRMMTPAQVARRKFKSALPRKPQNVNLPPMQAIGAVFTLLDQFRDTVHAEGQKMDPAKTVYAALAYSLPNTEKLVFTLTVPEPEKIGPFCEAVMALDGKKPAFLGVVFVQVDPETKNAAQKAVSFVVPFMSGPDADERLLFAQQKELAKIRKVMEGRRN